MKKLITFTILLIANTFANAQTIPATANAWVAKEKKMCKVAAKDYSTTTAANDLDFSTILLGENKYDNFLGFIGSNKQRLQLHITSVRKDYTRKGVYLVQGKSLVKGNLCVFDGFIIIAGLFKATPLNYGGGTPKEMGLLTAAYYFNEDASQKSTGHFEGVCMYKWEITQDGELKINDNEADGDGYYNNQYVGIWQSYTTKVKRPCNWGENRIPLCGDLDKGEYNFEPAKKYLPFGWQTYLNERNENPNNGEVTMWWE